MLLVRENTRVEVRLESVTLIAVNAVCWLVNATHLNCAFFFSEALCASKVRFFHFRDDIAVADDDTSERDEFFNVSWSQLPDAVHSSKVMGTHLDNVIITELVIVHVVVSILLVLPANVVHVELLVDLGDHQIEDRDDVSGVVFDLPIEHLVELEYVVAVNIEHICVHLTDFFETLDVVWGFLVLLVVIIIAVILDLLKVVNEVFEFHLDIVSVDVCAPQNLCVRAHFVSTLELAVIHHSCRGGLVICKLNCSIRVKCRLMEQAVDIEEAALLGEVRHQSRGVKHSARIKLAHNF